MPGRSVTDRLNAGEVLLMDGGTGTEILRRGAGGLTGPSPDNVMAWSAITNVDFSDVVQQVHKDYIRCGADVIISHNFRTGPSRLGTVGLADRWEECSRAAVRNAEAARDAMNPEVYIAGGIAPPTMQLRGGGNDGRSDVQVMGGDAYRKEFADHAKVLAEEGVDLLLPEFVGYQDDCVAAVEACAEARLPVWLGVRHIAMDGGMQYGETLEDLGRALEGHPVDAVLLMCCSPEAVTAGIPILRRSYSGVIGGYPAVALPGNVSARQNSDYEQVGDFLILSDYAPSRLAEFSREWKDLGAQIIGGCCATGPEHTLAQRDVVKAA